MNSFFSLFILMANYGIGKAAIGGPIPSWKAIHRTRLGNIESTRKQRMLTSFHDSFPWIVVPAMGYFSFLHTLCTEISKVVERGGKNVPSRPSLCCLTNSCRKRIMPTRGWSPTRPVNRRLVSNSSGIKYGNVSVTPRCTSSFSLHFLNPRRLEVGKLS